MKTHTAQSTRLAALSAAQQAPAADIRRPELDWLRTIIVLAIIPYHALLLFVTTSSTVIRHPIPLPTASLIYSSVDTWGISLIFLLAGAASQFALRSRSVRSYAAARLARLAIPAALVVLLFTPIQAYFLQLSSQYVASGTPITTSVRLQDIASFFVRYWASVFIPGTPMVVRNILAHLWFVPRLLIISLLCAPLFRSAIGRRWPFIDRLARSPHSAEALVLAAGLVPAALVTVLRPGWLNRLTAFSPVVDDWTIASLDLAMFVYGYLLYSDGRLLRAVARLTNLTLWAAVTSWAILLAILLGGSAPANDGTAPYFAFSLAQVYAMWLLTLAVLGLALRHLASGSSLLRYLTPAAFPVYVLHLPLLIVSAYYLQALPLPWYAQLSLVILATSAIAFALYAWVLRRTPPTRLLFGLESDRFGHDESGRRFRGIFDASWAKRQPTQSKHGRDPGAIKGSSLRRAATADDTCSATAAGLKRRRCLGERGPFKTKRASGTKESAHP